MRESTQQVSVMMQQHTHLCDEVSPWRPGYREALPRQAPCKGCRQSRSLMPWTTYTHLVSAAMPAIPSGDWPASCCIGSKVLHFRTW